MESAINIHHNTVIYYSKLKDKINSLDVSLDRAFVYFKSSISRISGE